jgi:chromosome partitioning protein
MHLMTALLWSGAPTAVIDLDLRQQSIGRFLSNRRTWLSASGAEAPMPTEVRLGEDVVQVAETNPQEALERFERALEDAKRENAYVVIDTPGGDTALMRAAHAAADLIVTPMNDSFLDFDLLGQVDPVTLDLVKPSIYSETVWASRKARAVRDGRSIDWVVLQTRLATADARNRRRLQERVTALSRRIGFRIAPGLRDRVIYRELFPFGLTVADLSAKVRPVSVQLAHVAARQELRALIQALKLETEAARPAA